MNRLLIIFSLIVFSLNSFSNEFEGRGWTFSNEVHYENFFRLAHDLPEKGLYVSVGGDRAFTGAAMASEAGVYIEGVINIDRDPRVLGFAQAIPLFARTAKSSNSFFYAMAKWPDVSWFTWAVVTFRHWTNRLWLSQRSIYEDNALFAHVRYLSSGKHLKTYNLDFNDLRNWQRLLQYLEEHELKIAVLDISNMLDGYVSARQITLAIEHLAPYLSDKAVIVNTQFCRRGVGHVKTHVHQLRDFMNRLNGRTRASLYLPECINQNVPGW